MIITYNNEEINLDYFFESLLYRHLIDMKIKPIQKSILLFIARKTIGFKKTADRIGIKEFEWKLEVKDYTIKKNIKELKKLDLIEVEYSSGGKSQSRKRFNEYKISNNILSQLINEWLEIKENNDFTV